MNYELLYYIALLELLRTFLWPDSPNELLRTFLWPDNPYGPYQ